MFVLWIARLIVLLSLMYTPMPFCSLLHCLTHPVHPVLPLAPSSSPSHEFPKPYCQKHADQCCGISFAGYMDTVRGG